MDNYSVLMSVYKKDTPEHLRLSIESMLGQSLLCEQFVIVQDGPLGEELESVIKEYATAQPELFTVVALEENVGLARALDLGIAQCRNELVARMDADDVSLPTRCQRLLKLFQENEKLSLAGTNIDEFYDTVDNVVSSRVVPSDYESICKFARRRNPFNHPSVMFKKSEVIRCGGYGDRRRGQDYDLFSRMVNMDCYALNINESLLLFRADENNYKRRKNWQSCKNHIDIQKINYKRGYCSLWDLTVVAAGQTFMYIAPMGVMKWVSDKFLRKRSQK